MLFLESDHNLWLVVAALCVALVAGFTGLTMLKDMSARSLQQRRVSVALAAVALGGGIWSMHFIAMLGLQLPVLFYYDAVITLASALVCILLVGVALVVLHFRERTTGSIVLAGGIVATAVLAMHYLGMAGLQLCRAVYTPLGLAVAVVAAVAFCVGAFWVAYGERSNRTILLGTVCFGAAVFAVHFVAMAGTRFVAVPGASEFGPAMSNEVLAMGVLVSSFLLFGAFLWMATVYLAPEGQGAPVVAQAQDTGEPESLYAEDESDAEGDPLFADPVPEAGAARVPCEKDGTTLFVAPRDVAIVRAEGHYTQVYARGERYFCSWPITEAGKRLRPAGFLKAHRSYLINPAFVETFERQKDNGVVRFGDGVPPVPVSRSNLKSVRTALGL